MSRDEPPRPGVCRASPTAAFLLAILVSANASLSAAPSSGTGAGPGGQGGMPLGAAPWLVLGPIDPAAERSGISDSGGLLPPALVSDLDCDYLAGVGGEGGARPGAVQAAGSPEWLEVPGLEGKLDLGTSLGAGEGAVAYAYRELLPRGAGPLRLTISSSCALKAWLDGVLVYARAASREAIAESLAFDFGRGGAALLVKAQGGHGAFGFSLRIDPLAEDGASPRPAARKASELGLVLLEPAARAGGALRGIVLDGESCRGEALVSARGPDGALVARARAPIGRPFSLGLPAGFEGVASVTAEGAGGLAGLRSPSRPALAGEPRALVASSIALARAAARGSFPFDAAGRAGAAWASAMPSTLTWLAEALEARTAERPGFEAGVEALRTVSADARSLATGRPPEGTARWAYRSPVDGALLPFSLHVPRGRDPSSPRGLILALPGAGEDDRDAVSRMASVDTRGLVVAAPSGRGDFAYGPLAERDALDLLGLVSRSHNVDPDRVFLVASPADAGSSWCFAQLHAGLFAAMALRGGPGGLAYAESLSGKPCLPLPAGRLEPKEVLGFFEGRRRDPWPATLELRAPRAAYGRGAWASVLGLSRPGLPASLSARVIDGRHLAIETDLVDAISLDLGHPLLAKGGRILVDADGAAFALDAGGREVELARSAESGRFERVAPGGPASSPPNPGGGFAQLLQRPLFIVYGTADKREAPFLEALAREFAALAGFPGRGLDQARVLRDSELRPWMRASASFVLVGSPSQNREASRIASSLPVSRKGGRLVVGDAGYGDSTLFMVLPDPGSPGRALGLLWPGRTSLDASRLALLALAPIPSEEDPAVFLPSVGTPDLRIVDPEGRTLRAAAWDRGWKALRDIGK